MTDFLKLETDLMRILELTRGDIDLRREVTLSYEERREFEAEELERLKTGQSSSLKELNLPSRFHNMAARSDARTVQGLKDL